MMNAGAAERVRVLSAWTVLVHNIMRKIFFLLFGILFFFSSFILHPLSFIAQAASVSEVVKNLQARYDSTAGFRADFMQEVESATLGQKIEARGTMVFKKPGRM